MTQRLLYWSQSSSGRLTSVTYSTPVPVSQIRPGKMSEITLVFLLLLSTAMSVKTQPVDSGSENSRSDTHASTDCVESVTDKVTHWNVTSDGVKWQHGCDVPGYDIEYQFKPIEESHVKLCSQACIDTSGCNAFRWNDAWCFLKNVPATSFCLTAVDRGTCGFLPWMFVK